MDLMAQQLSNTHYVPVSSKVAYRIVILSLTFNHLLSMPVSNLIHLGIPLVTMSNAINVLSTKA